MLSSSKRTALAEVLMPRPLDQSPIALCDFHRLVQRSGIEAEAGGDPNLWFGPQFGLAAAQAHMHVQRLPRAAFIGMEEEAEPLVADDVGAGANLLGFGRLQNAEGTAAGVAAGLNTLAK